ncbi:MAG: Ig domain-containing protein [Gemmatimonadales bacterium]
MTTRQTPVATARMVLATIAAALAYVACSSSTSPKSGAVASVVISPDSLGLTIGASGTLQAVAHDGQSKTVGGQTFFWSTSDSNVVRVSQSGEVTGVQAGAVQIGASTDGKTGFARVIVAAALVHSVTVAPPLDTIFASAPSNTVTLSATSFDAQGHELAGRPVTWSTSSSLVSVANGVVTATDAAAGSATVTATSSDPGSPSGSATVVVIGHVATVTLSPSNTVLSASGNLFANTVQLSAQLIDTFNTDVSGQRTVTWSSNNPSVATVNSATGLVTAVADVGNGKATITATTADGATGTTKVSVLP